MDAHHQPREVSGALHREGADEEVENGCGKEYEGRHVVQVVQTVLQGTVIQVPAACHTHKHTHTRTVDKESVYTPSNLLCHQNGKTSCTH